MGQYHIPVNLDRREFITPHKFGNGLKLWEQSWSNPVGTGTALVMLTACSNGRGGGDFREDPTREVVGRWAGNRIAIVGDYAEDDDLPSADRASQIYGQCGEPGGFTDISDIVCAFMEKEFEGRFIGDGWRQFVRVGDKVWRCNPDVQGTRESGKIEAITQVSLSIEWSAHPKERVKLNAKSFNFFVGEF